MTQVIVVPPSTETSARAGVRLWERNYLRFLLTADVGAVVLAVLAGWFLRFGVEPITMGTAPPVDSGGLNYALVGTAVFLGWVIALQGAGSYELRFLAIGAEELKRITKATLWLLGTLAVVSYSFKLEVARGFVAGVIPIGYLLLLGGRGLARHWIRARRARGHASYNILAVGTRSSVAHLVQQIRHSPYVGLRVVGACLRDGEGEEPVAAGVPVVGGLIDVADTAATLDVDVVATAGSHAAAPEFLRDLGWALEGTGRRLVVAPSLTNIAGPRITVAPVAGLPLVWVDEPEFSSLTRIAKRMFDLIVASALLVLLSPVLLATAAAVHVTSRGPVLFRQARAGIHGSEFRVWKFRSMHHDAESRRASLMAANEANGHLFKIRHDPRVTWVGRYIRRFSLDELPQLLNVIAGEMSLVGPRPLASVDSNYEGHARRRLLVQPGITGLWQVSGRADTTWEEAVRLDLYYVENWSLSLDLVILARTVFAVVRGNGAY